MDILKERLAANVGVCVASRAHVLVQTSEAIVVVYSACTWTHVRIQAKEEQKLLFQSLQSHLRISALPTWPSHVQGLMITSLVLALLPRSL